MAPISLYGTDTTGTWGDIQNGYSNLSDSTAVTQVSLSRFAAVQQDPVVTVVEAARRALGRARACWWESETPVLAAQMHGGAVAPRRAVPSRGVVSWVRAGTRRPLRARRA